MPFIGVGISALVSSIGVFGTVALVAGVAVSVATFAMTLGSMSKLKGAGSARDRNMTIRSAAGLHELVVGQSRKGAVITFVEKHPTNGRLICVYTLAPHACKEIGAIYFGDVEVLTDSSGNAVAPYALPDGTTPKSYVGVAYIRRALGNQADDATFHSWMAANTTTWTPDCRQDGRAKIVIEWIWNEQILGGSLPNVTAIIKGRMNYDSRMSGLSLVSSTAANPAVFTVGAAHGVVPGNFVHIRGHTGAVPEVNGIYEVATTPTSTTLTLHQYSQALALSVGGSGGNITRTEWSDNCELVAADYLADKDYGLGARFDEDLVLTNIQTEANICDEYVSRPLPQSTFTANAGTDEITYNLTSTAGDLPDFCEVSLSSTGTLPAGLAINTIYIFKQTNNGPVGKLATSIANAKAGTFVNITDAGTGTHTLTVTSTFTVRLATGDNGANSLVLTSPVLRILNGTKVIVASTGTLPSGLAAATDYYAIFQTTTRIRLATSLANAREGIAISLGSAGSGVHTIAVTGELRYTANGLISTQDTPADIIDSICDSMAGDCVPQGTSIGLFSGAYRTPTVTLDEDDLVGSMTVQALQSAQRSFNSTRGMFFDPFGMWQTADFPSYKSSGYIADDNNEVIWQDFKFLFVNSSGQAQRVARIELERMRREYTINQRLRYSAFQLSVPDTFFLNNSLYNFQSLVFEQQHWSFAVQDDAGGIPALVIDSAARLTDSAVFAWTAADEQRGKRGVATGFGAQLAPAPTGLVLEEVGQNVIATWVAPATGKLLGYNVLLAASGGAIGTAVFQVFVDATTVTLPLPSGTHRIYIQSVDIYGVAGNNTFAEITVSASPVAGSMTIQYQFDSSTTDADPGNGDLRLNAGTQRDSTKIYADLLDRHGTDVTALLDALDDGNGTVKGYFKLVKANDPTKWLVGALTLVTTATGYRKIDIAVTQSNAASPLTNGDFLYFIVSGDPINIGLDISVAGPIDIAGPFPTETTLASGTYVSTASQKVFVEISAKFDLSVDADSDGVAPIELRIYRDSTEVWSLGFDVPFAGGYINMNTLTDSPMLFQVPTVAGSHTWSFKACDTDGDNDIDAQDVTFRVTELSR